MVISSHRAAWIAAAMLFITVISQAIYVGAGEATSMGLGKFLWRVETIAYLVLALYALRLARQHPLAAAGLLIGGVFNVLQLGIGLHMFEALRQDGVPEAVRSAVVQLAFFLYFAGKFGIGFAAAGLGHVLFRSGLGAVGWTGIIAMLMGISAICLAMLAMLGGEMRFVVPAGAAGTAAALLAGITLPLVYRTGERTVGKSVD